MWFPVTLLLLVGVAVATLHEHAWETENEYLYILYSRTLAGLDELKQQYTGVQLKCFLTIQVKSPETLLAKLSNPQYAHIHNTLLNGPDSEIPDQMLEYRELPMSEMPFEIKLKHGVIQDLLIDPKVPTWELNIIKSVVSQIQLDMQGENAIESKSTQFPINENSTLMFRAMEDSVGGKCEVLYDIVPMPHNFHEVQPDRIPLPQLLGDGRYYDVKKMKNYQKCQQRQLYYHGLNEPLMIKNPNKQEIPLQLSETQMIISGHLKNFTIQSVVTKSQIFVKSEKSLLGSVHSIIKLTLVKKDNLLKSKLELPELTNLQSTGNLVYTYNNPFSEFENRNERYPSISRNSTQIKSPESSSSSSQSSLNESSLSSSSSSEENNVPDLQPRAALHLAPNVPLLPLYVGYKGKSILMSDEIDVVERAQNLILQIAKELQSPQQMLNNDTLEKQTILKKLLRIMNRKQYAELEDRLLHKDEKYLSQNERSIWNVLRDAVTQAGTGPALLTIENWIENKIIQGIEAARIISQIPKAAYELTIKFMKKFFDFISNPLVSKQKYLNVSAPLALGELILKSRVNQKLYSTRSFGSMSLENELVDSYISYLGQELEQGFLEKNTLKIQTYIAALGLTAHPNIIPIFEPYIEGTKPISHLQRLFMVVMLNPLAKIEPKLVGPIFYKLYLDPRENYEIRSIAVQQFILTNPPLLTLQRIAKYTNVDKEKEVNSAVITTIDSIVHLKLPEWQDLANKARSVKPLLNPVKPNILSSRGYYRDFDYWFLKSLALQTVNNHESKIPVFLRFAMNTILNDFNEPTLIGGYTVSSSKQLLNEIIADLWLNHEEASEESNVEKLARALKIKSGNTIELEGNVFFYNHFGSLFYPFDTDTVKQVCNYVKKSVLIDSKVESTVFNNYETTMSFPTESGLPFIYNLESPLLVKLQLEWKKEESSKKKYGVINTVLANKLQKRFGFVAPFAHQNYITGIDTNRVLQLSLEYEVELDTNQRSVALKIRPNLSQTQMDSKLTLLHYSTIPFTTRQDILDLRPVSLDKNMHQVLTSEKYKTTAKRDMLSVVVESDNKEIESNNLGANFAMFWKELNNIWYKKLDILLNTTEVAKSEFSINVVYDNMKVGANDDNNEKQSYELESQGFAIEEWKPNSMNRRNQIMKGLGRGLKSGKVHVIDINYNVPLSHEQQVVSIGMVNSNVDRKSKAYVYWNAQSLESEEKKYEVCYAQEILYSPNNPLDFEYTLKNAPIDKYKGELLHGKNCKQETKIVVVGTATRSNQLKTMIENSQIAKQCQEEIQKGNKAALACQKAIELAQTKDKYDLSFKEFVENLLRDLLNRIVDVLMIWLSKIAQHLVNNITITYESEAKLVILNMSVSPFDAVPHIHLRTSLLDITFPYIMEPTLETQSLLTDILQKDLCTLDNNQIITFDERVYPVILGPVKHVLLTTYPYQDLRNHYVPYTIPEKLRVAVLAEDADNGSKNVVLFLDNREVKLMKLNNRLVAKVSGEIVELSQNRSYEDYQNGEINFEILRLPDGSIKVIADKYGLEVVYDGKIVQISLSDNYRNAIRGLCGNYDSDPRTDFLTPQNCLLTKAEEFAATYALIEKDTQGPVLENKLKAEQAQCQELLLEPQYHKNVISDGEAGRMWTENKNWGYHHKKEQRPNYVQYNKKYNQELEDKLGDYQKNHNMVYRTKVLEEGDELCFTTRPVLTCLKDTTPMETKPKQYQLYCQPKNEEFMAMKQRVEQGANPDLTRKSVTKSHVFQVPSLCVAA